MSKHTNATTLVDCDCKALAYKDGSGIELEYCPLHKAAPDLLEVCKRLMKDDCNVAPQACAIAIHHDLRAAIKKAEGAQ